eukprot:m.122107 g.122107  ORF g.122107 m.122107 type:complete len:476 (-) comp16217_c1_seq1:373-1800(-)
MARLTREVAVVAVVAMLLRALRRTYRLGPALMAGLTFHQHPTPESLRAIAQSAASSGKKKGDKQKGSNSNEVALSSEEQKKDFTLPTTKDIQLRDSKVEQGSFRSLHFEDDLEDILGLLLGALALFVIYELVGTLFGIDLSNNSAFLWWNIMVVFWALRNVFTFLLLYRGYEMATVIFVILTCFMLTFAALTAGDHYLDFGMKQAYADTAERFKLFTKSLSIEMGVPGLRLVKVSLAIVLAPVGSAIAFPTFRHARCHLSAMKNAEHGFLTRLLVQLNVFLPVIACLLWVPDFGTDVFAPASLPQKEREQALASFENGRMVFCFIICLVRILTFRPYMQAYLDVAKERLDHIHSFETQKKAKEIYASAVIRYVGNIFLLTCFAAVQLVSPLAVLLCNMMLWKQRGGMGWFGSQAPVPELPLIPEDAPDSEGVALTGVLFYRSFCGFITWWYFSMSTLLTLAGIIHTRFKRTSEID